MFIILAGFLLIMGLFVALRGRKALKKSRSDWGYMMAIIGLMLIVSAALLLWAVSALHPQSCTQCL
jgi:hypothetical protein